MLSIDRLHDNSAYNKSHDNINHCKVKDYVSTCALKFKLNKYDEYKRVNYMEITTNDKS